MDIVVDEHRGEMRIGPLTLTFELHDGGMVRLHDVGAVLRPLTFAERRACVRAAAGRADAVDVLCTQLVQLSTVMAPERPIAGSITTELAALVLAGAAATAAPPFHDTLRLAAAACGCEPVDLDDLPAADVDRLAGVVVQQHDQTGAGWTTVLFDPEPEPPEMRAAVRAELAVNLLSRVQPDPEVSTAAAMEGADELQSRHLRGREPAAGPASGAASIDPFTDTAPGPAPPGASAPGWTRPLGRAVPRPELDAEGSGPAGSPRPAGPTSPAGPTRPAGLTPPAGMSAWPPTAARQPARPPTEPWASAAAEATAFPFGSPIDPQGDATAHPGHLRPVEPASGIGPADTEPPHMARGRGARETAGRWPAQRAEAPAIPAALAAPPQTSWPTDAPPDRHATAEDLSTALPSTLADALARVLDAEADLRGLAP